MTPKPNFTPRAQQAINEAKKVAEKYGYKLVDHKLELYGIKKKS